LPSICSACLILADLITCFRWRLQIMNHLIIAFSLSACNLILPLLSEVLKIMTGTEIF
jgi:hypothetical protein